MKYNLKILVASITYCFMIYFIDSSKLIKNILYKFLIVKLQIISIDGHGRSISIGNLLITGVVRGSRVDLEFSSLQTVHSQVDFLNIISIILYHMKSFKIINPESSFGNHFKPSFKV
jgi:hypothetical protein